MSSDERAMRLVDAIYRAAHVHPIHPADIRTLAQRAGLDLFMDEGAAAHGEQPAPPADAELEELIRALILAGTKNGMATNQRARDRAALAVREASEALHAFVDRTRAAAPEHRPASPVEERVIRAAKTWHAKWKGKRPNTDILPPSEGAITMLYDAVDAMLAREAGAARSGEDRDTREETP